MSFPGALAGSRRASPTIAESARRLRLIEEQGPTEDAFTFIRFYPKPTA